MFVKNIDNIGSEQVDSSSYVNKTIYNFVLPGKSLRITGKLKYNFESKSLKVMFPFTSMFEEGHIGKYVNNLIKLKMTDNKKGSYLASNIFGATVNVRRYTGVEYCISVQNRNDIHSISKEQYYTQIKGTEVPATMSQEPLELESRLKKLRDETPEEFYNIIKFKASPELARLSMEDISILFVCKVKRPAISTGRSGHNATIFDPILIDDINKCVNVDVLEIWVFNAKSGEIYHKQQII